MQEGKAEEVKVHKGEAAKALVLDEALLPQDKATTGSDCNYAILSHSKT